MSELMDIDIARLFYDYLNTEFSSAVRKLKEQTKPATNLPRPRFFVILPPDRVVWPFRGKYGVEWGYVAVNIPGYSKSLEVTSWVLTKALADAVGHQPRGALRVLRRFQAAADWCRARHAGRVRAAREIVRQQAQACAALEAEAILQKLS
ncbi:MAG: hypothetical protein C4298_08610 [Thermus sp.]